MNADMLDLSTVPVFSSPADIASWQVSRSITKLTMRPTGDPAAGLAFEFDQALPESWKWPTGTGSDHYQYTVWIVVPGFGAAAFIQMWQGRPSTGAPILTDFHTNWAYSSRWGRLNEYFPKAGDVVGFFVSAGNARDQGKPTSVRERSNVVSVMLPASDSATYTFGAIDLSDKVVPAPTANLPMPIPVAPAWSTLADVNAARDQVLARVDKCEQDVKDGLKSLQPLLAFVNRFYGK